jgi:hypothetical protein
MQDTARTDKIEEFWKIAQPYCISKAFVDGNYWIKLKSEYFEGSKEYDNLVTKADRILNGKNIQLHRWGFIISKPKTEEQNHEDEYSLSLSRIGLGELVPVLKDANNNIIDGFHRKLENENWHEIIVPQIDNEVKLELARIAVNFVRRQVSHEELKKCLTYLISEQKLTPQQIAETTGISLTTIYRHIPQALKNQVRVQAGKASGKSRVTKASFVRMGEQNMKSIATKPIMLTEANQEKAQAVSTETNKIQHKGDRDLDKFKKGAWWAPEGLVETLCGLGGTKVTQEKLNDECKKVFTLLYEWAAKEREIDKILARGLNLNDVENIFKEAYYRENNPDKFSKKPVGIFKVSMLKRLLQIPNRRESFRRLWKDEIRELCDVEAK